MPELDDERYVRELLEQLHGVQLRKMPEADSKTFDFELLSSGRRVAAVEVKTLGRTPRTKANGWITDEHGFDTRTDNGASRIGDAIHAAYKQLSAAAEPKTLVIVNDDAIDALDLDEAVNGYLMYGEGDLRFKNTAAQKITRGRIRDEKLAIAMYIWINRYEGRHLHRVDGQPLPLHQQRGPFFRFTSDAGHDLAKTYFGVPDTPRPPADPNADVPTLNEMLMREAGITRP
jgi:hypothetical protein